MSRKKTTEGAARFPNRFCSRDWNQPMLLSLPSVRFSLFVRLPLLSCGLPCFPENSLPLPADRCAGIFLSFVLLRPCSRYIIGFLLIKVLFSSQPFWSLCATCIVVSDSMVLCVFHCLLIPMFSSGLCCCVFVPGTPALHLLHPLLCDYS